MPTAPIYLGLMSGTSLDGISAAVVRFHSLDDGTPRLRTELLGYSVSSYDAEQRRRLHAAMREGTAREYCRLGFDFGAWQAEAAIAVLAEAGLSRAEVRAIGMHGQTLWHEPPHSTWQFGESAVVAERVGCDVVSDFRVRDLAAGGQGAPLVPIADALLFSGDDWRALQNVGGIGNVSVVPPGGDPQGVRAFDTGPGVAVLDAVVRRLAPDLPYDVDGKLARQGTPIEPVLATLLAEPYFLVPPPKSTGRELFDPAYVDRFLVMCREAKPDASTPDLVATATALTARSIADAYRRFVPEPVREVLMSGGGAKNPALIDTLAPLVAPVAVRQFDDLFFDGEAKEAVAFALLAHLFCERQPANVVGATGARGPRILGKLTPA
ncbi:MAG TPA: anhydro-N-acetylmuramic acid kinase [Gemmatimonadaceae bacterium]|nr:anhydro-N-acetylmuramic acid kinase [Gemmatimonadaceae bacterium]